MRSLSLAEVQFLHAQILAQSGGALGIRSQGALESALAQPLMTFGGEELYPTVIEKAAALGFSLIMNHPFVDGNKRVGHAVMETLSYKSRHRLTISTSPTARSTFTSSMGGCFLARWLGFRA